MNLTYVPLLQVQRDLYTVPRGFERFRAYVQTMIDPTTNDITLPLAGMNPMGKDHLLPFLDHLLAIDADGVAAQIIAEAHSSFSTVPGAWSMTTVVTDDAHGGWTNRTSNEFAQRCGERAYYKRGWLTAVLWTGDTYDRYSVRVEVLTSIYRFSYIQQHGYAHTLGDLIAQEGYAMSMAGAITPTLDPDDLAYTRDMLTAYQQNTDQPTLIAALFGDTAAHELGYPRLGLSPRAGLAIALHDAVSK